MNTLWDSPVSYTHLDVYKRQVIDNVISYENSWDKLTYSAMLGHSYEEYNYETFGAYSDNYANGAYPSSSFGLIDVYKRQHLLRRSYLVGPD